MGTFGYMQNVVARYQNSSAFGSMRSTLMIHLRIFSEVFSNHFEWWECVPRQGFMGLTTGKEISIMAK